MRHIGHPIIEDNNSAEGCVRRYVNDFFSDLLDRTPQRGPMAKLYCLSDLG